MKWLLVSLAVLVIGLLAVSVPAFWKDRAANELTTNEPRSVENTKPSTTRFISNEYGFSVENPDPKTFSPVTVGLKPSEIVVFQQEDARGDIFVVGTDSQIAATNFTTFRNQIEKKYSAMYTIPHITDRVIGGFNVVIVRGIPGFVDGHARAYFVAKDRTLYIEGYESDQTEAYFNTLEKLP